MCSRATAECPSVALVLDRQQFLELRLERLQPLQRHSGQVHRCVQVAVTMFENYALVEEPEALSELEELAVAIAESVREWLAPAAAGHLDRHYLLACQLVQALPAH